MILVLPLVAAPFSLHCLKILPKSWHIIVEWRTNPQCKSSRLDIASAMFELSKSVGKSTNSASQNASKDFFMLLVFPSVSSTNESHI